MPKSSVRKKKVYTPPAELRPQAAAAAAKKPSPTWVPATAVALIVFAIVWLVLYYLTRSVLRPRRVVHVPGRAAVLEPRHRVRGHDRRADPAHQVALTAH